MLNTYIKNRGLSQTIIHDNNNNQFNEINWEADYDGNNANISISSNLNGIKDLLNVNLDNDDLVKILTIPSIDIPLEKRLKRDFNKNYSNRINKEETYNMTLPQFNQVSPLTNYLSSPLPEEELIVPISITNTKQKLPKKTHNTYKVYKKLKSHSHSPKTKSISRYIKKSNRKYPFTSSHKKKSIQSFTLGNSM